MIRAARTSTVTINTAATLGQNQRGQGSTAAKSLAGAAPALFSMLAPEFAGAAIVSRIDFSFATDAGRFATGGFNPDGLAVFDVSSVGGFFQGEGLSVNDLFGGTASTGRDCAVDEDRGASISSAADTDVSKAGADIGGCNDDPLVETGPDLHNSPLPIAVGGVAAVAVSVVCFQPDGGSISTMLPHLGQE